MARKTRKAYSRRPFCVYINVVPELPETIKIGWSGSVFNRRYNMSCPGENHRIIWLSKTFGTEPAARYFENNLKLLYREFQVPHESKHEYFKVGDEEIARISGAHEHVLNKLRAAMDSSGPHTLEECVAAGMVSAKFKVYYKHIYNGLSGEDKFRADMREIGCEPTDVYRDPTDVYRDPAEDPRASWSAQVFVSPGSNGFVSKHVQHEMRLLSRRGKKMSRLSYHKDGSVSIWSCGVFRAIGHLLFPARTLVDSTT